MFFRGKLRFGSMYTYVLIAISVVLSFALLLSGCDGEREKEENTSEVVSYMTDVEQTEESDEEENEEKEEEETKYIDYETEGFYSETGETVNEKDTEGSGESDELTESTAQTTYESESTVESDSEEQSTEKNVAQVYSQYSNLARISKFENGLAAFLIHDANSHYHWSSSGAWNGDYYYGFIDVKGNVVIEAKFECNPHAPLPSFEYNYTKLEDADEYECIIDKNGNVKFETGKNNISAIGKVSEGYFWVETLESEDLSGKKYSVRYYSAEDLSVVATFDNIRAIPDNRTIGGTNSTLTPTGEGKLAYNLNQSSYSGDELLIFNISEYDRSYKPESETEEGWNVDLDKVGNFSDASVYYHHVSGNDNSKGQLATVALKNVDGTWFYSIVDSEGNVLMQPQKNITFPIANKKEMSRYNFCKDLCPAKDAESGCWGYVDVYGNWKIQPQYSSVVAFSTDGYATVNDKIVIDTEGRIVLSPDGWVNETVTSLSGTYKLKADTGMGEWYLEFTEDGELTLTNETSYSSSWKTGSYQLKGSVIVISKIGYNIGCPIYTSGEYAFKKEGDTLIIGESEWVFQDDTSK